MSEELKEVLAMLFIILGIGAISMMFWAFIIMANPPKRLKGRSK